MKLYEQLVEYVVGLLLILLLLLGCAAPKTEYVPYQVPVPVAVPCAAAVPPEPEWATKDMPRVDPKTGDEIDVAVDKLVAERKQRQGYAAKLKAAIEGCR